MDPCDVEKLPYLKKEGLLHAAIMSAKMQDADGEVEGVRANLQAWVKRMQQRGRSR